MNELATVMIRDCNEKIALNMATTNDSKASSKRKTFEVLPEGQRCLTRCA